VLLIAAGELMSPGVFVHQAYHKKYHIEDPRKVHTFRYQHFELQKLLFTAILFLKFHSYLLL
jgi:hypothetical protein